MNINDILELTKQGWTKEEILALTKEQPAEEPASEEPAAEEPAVAEPTPVKDERIDAILDKLDKIASGIQTNALKGTRMPERESADDALAKIINPYIESNRTGGLNNGSK